MQPLPLVVADQQFPVSLARLIRATLQPEAAFIEAHYQRMGYWAIAIEPWALDAGAQRILVLSSLRRRCTINRHLGVPHVVKPFAPLSY